MNIEIEIFLLALIVLFVSSFYFLRIKVQIRQARQQLGLSWLQSLKVMLSNAQQHRGKTSGYLSGNTSLKGEIEELQRRVSKNISETVAIGSWIEANAQWQGLTQHWARLTRSYLQNNADNNFTQHNLFIKNLLYFIDEMAEAHDLLLLNGANKQPFHIAWRDLLSTAESIGQARALGVGAAALGKCSTVNRIRINFLHQQINDNARMVWQKIPPSSEQKLAVENLLHSMLMDIAQEKVTMDSKEYFELATKALESLHLQYDKLIEEKRWQIS